MGQMLRRDEDHGTGAEGVPVRTQSHAGRRGIDAGSASGAAIPTVQRAPRRRERKHKHGPGGPLEGKTQDGDVYRFDYHHVQVEPLYQTLHHMQREMLIGIVLPSKRDDSVEAENWARQSPSWHTRIFNVTVHGDIRGEYSLDIGHSEPAPWSSRPLVVRVHSSGSLFGVLVDAGDGTQVQVTVNGATLGKILRRCPYYREAARLAPGKDGLLMACLSGNPQGTGAQDFAKSMHDHGSERNWFAPTGIVLELNDIIPSMPGVAGIGSEQAWDLDGNPITEKFKRYSPESSGHASESSGYGSVSYAPASSPYGPVSYSSYGPVSYASGYSASGSGSYASGRSDYGAEPYPDYPYGRR
jgi:hypothetical protein